MESMNRRDFVKTTAATAAITGLSLWTPGSSWAGANDRLRVAVAGIRGQGKGHIRNYAGLENVEVVALCDVDKRLFPDRVKMLTENGHKEPKLYTDIRKVLENKDIDIISFATPNHWHSLGTIWACQAGKDVYVEKPLSHNIFEGRKLVEAAQKYKRIIQHGTQMRSSLAMHAAVEFLQAGGLGELYMAKGLCYKWRDTIGRTPDEPAPKEVDYDLWLGPAPKRPFSKNRFHYNWHWHWDYGNGDIGNQGIHQMDVARWGLDVGLPKKIQSMGGHFMFDDDQETANTQIATFEYPDEKKMLVFEVRHWITNHEGGIGEGPSNTVGVIFYGSEGYLVVDSYSSFQTFLGKKREPGPSAKIGGDHFKNFIQAVRSRDESILNANAEEGHISSALCHLANTAYRLGRTLEFDPATEKYINDDEANKTVTREYRIPFVVEDTV
ncbi:Gfo/Idh/MocA family oxidoreductase [candidate division KSB1 bacterium]|nr:Gfo/Idh/MocA family oxidoreductase [candidate division KSB1 bacterium]